MKTPLVKAGCLSMTCTVALVLVVSLMSVHICEALGANVQSDNTDGAGALAKAPSLQSQPAVNGSSYRRPILNYQYQGGRILWKPIRLYFVWYGNWTESYKALLRTAAKSLTPSEAIKQWPNLSNLWKIEREFYQEILGEGRKYVSNQVTIGGEVDDNYSFGNSISTNNDVVPILSSHVGSDLPMDLEQGVYFLFPSGDVDLQGWGGCSYHDYTCLPNNTCTDYTQQMIYVFLPLISEVNGLLHGCQIFQHDTETYGMPGPPPNAAISSSGAVDAFVNSFLHQLFRTVVDPYWFDAPAWYHNTTENTETANLCSYSFAAGDWYYCRIRSIWGNDFPDGLPFRCLSFPNGHALEEPKSQAQFTHYGIDGSKFMVQMMWNLASKGCASQIEEACSSKTVLLKKLNGTVKRGLFFRGVGMQAYAPGQVCKWKILVPKAKFIKLTFQKLALGYDDLDFVTVSHDKVLIRKLTGFGSNLTVKVTGNEATITFVSDGGRSPSPDSAGFILTYAAGDDH